MLLLLMCILVSLQVNPSETWLRDDSDDALYFPHTDGTFNLHNNNITTYTTLIVEGPAQAAASSLPRANNLPRASSLVTVSSTPTTSSLPPPPTFRSVTAPRRVPSFSLKVLKAKLTKNGRRKPDFEPLNQTYIELVESTANLEHILVLVRRHWGLEYTIVTSDGMYTIVTSDGMALNWKIHQPLKVYMIITNACMYVLLMIIAIACLCKGTILTSVLFSRSCILEVSTKKTICSYSQRPEGHQCFYRVKENHTNRL